MVGFFVPTGMRRLLAQEAPAAAAKLPVANAFLRIAPDESVTVLLAHSEMGQGIWTTLPMLVNEELGADWSRIRVEHAPADPTYAHTAYGIQMTGGSTTTWSEFDRYRHVGASTDSCCFGGRAALGCARERVPDGKGIRHPWRQAALLRLARGRGGEASRAENRVAQGAEGLEAHRQADAAARHAREDHREGDVRHRRPVPGHA